MRFAMTVIPLGAPLPTCSSHLPADVTRAASMYAYLVLLRMEVAAFHPLPRIFTCAGSDSSLWPYSSPSRAARAAAYNVRELPGILLCGGRTCLSPFRLHFRRSDGPAAFQVP